MVREVDKIVIAYNALRGLGIKTHSKKIIDRGIRMTSGKQMMEQFYNYFFTSMLHIIQLCFIFYITFYLVDLQAIIDNTDKSYSNCNRL